MSSPPIHVGVSATFPFPRVTEKWYTMRRRKMSKRAERFIQRKVRKLRHEGYGPRQSVAVAYAMARDKGYKVPRRNRQRR